MQLNFDQIYDLLNSFATQINTKTNEVFTNVVEENISSISEQSSDITNDLQNTTDKGNLNGGLNIQGFAQPHRWDLQYEDTNDGRADLMKQIYALQQNDTSVERQAKLHGIVSFMQSPAETAINTDGLNEVEAQANDIVQSKKNEISDIQDKIVNDYDNFVKSLQTTLVADETQTATLGTSLFTANKGVIDTVKSEPHPTESYLNLNKTVMDGFAKALNTHSAEELNMSLLTYNETKNYVNNTSAAVDEGLSLLAMNESNHKPVLLASTAGGGM